MSFKKGKPEYMVDIICDEKDIEKLRVSCYYGCESLQITVGQESGTFFVRVKWRERLQHYYKAIDTNLEEIEYNLNHFKYEFVQIVPSQGFGNYLFIIRDKSNVFLFSSKRLFSTIEARLKR